MTRAVPANGGVRACRPPPRKRVVFRLHSSAGRLLSDVQSFRFPLLVRFLFFALRRNDGGAPLGGLQTRLIMSHGAFTCIGNTCFCFFKDRVSVWEIKKWADTEEPGRWPVGCSRPTWTNGCALRTGPSLGRQPLGPAACEAGTGTEGSPTLNLDPSTSLRLVPFSWGSSHPSCFLCSSDGFFLSEGSQNIKVSPLCG